MEREREREKEMMKLQQQLLAQPSCDLPAASAASDMAMMMMRQLPDSPFAGNPPSPIPFSDNPPPASSLQKDSFGGLGSMGMGMGMMGAHDPEMDMILANAGYNVKASDMEHVAQRLQQLESALCAAQEAGLSHLSSEAVHYNPSDLAGWIEFVIGELAPALPGELQPPPRPPSPPLPPPVAAAVGTAAEAEFASLIGPCSTDVVPSLKEKASYVVIDDPSGHHDTSQVSAAATEEVCNSKHAYVVVDDDAVPTSSSAPESLKGKRPYISIVDDDVTPKPASTFSQVGKGKASRDARRKDRVQHAPLSSCRAPGGTGAPSSQSSNRKAGLREPSTASTSSPMMPPRDHGDQETRVVATNQHENASPSCPYPQQPIIYADVEVATQEDGIRLVHLLMACAEAVQGNMFPAALEMVAEIRRLASPQSGTMGKVASHFAEGLARRIYGINSDSWIAVTQADANLLELLYTSFYDTCPYLKFAHFTANQAILEAFEGHKFVHVIDFNLVHGLQWPVLIQALASRPGGPPHLRLTGVGPPQPDNKDVLQEIGIKLAQLAESVNLEFAFRGVVATKLNDVKPWMLQVQLGEAIAVNCIFQLHRLLCTDPNSSVASPIDVVLHSIKSLNPRIVTVVEQEANHNSPVFIERFTQALQYYCTMFDSLEECCLPSPQLTYTEMYLGREIVNIVASEGMSRIERHETLPQWRLRMSSAGFRPLHLGSDAFNQASLLLRLFSGEGYTVEENYGCLTLGWHSRPLIAASAWQCG